MSTRRTLSRRDLLQSVAAAGIPLPSRRFLGITVMPEDFQVEGIRRVLHNVQVRAGANAVATAPYVMAPSDRQHGQRQPPVDAGAGAVRLLDRPLWGKREIYTTSSPSFVPDLRLYRGLRYQPSAPDALTRQHGHTVRDFLDAARSERLRTYFQIQSAIPPDYIVTHGGPIEEDKPRLPNGTTPVRRVGNTGSIASPHIRAYTEALIKDLAHQYPDVDGFRVDWPEYPQYFLDDAFYDFGFPAKAAADRLGIPFERMRRETEDLYTHIHGKLTDRELERGTPLLPWMSKEEGLASLGSFKAQLVTEMLAGFRAALTSASGKQKELVPNAFPPPFSFSSGMDYSSIARHVDGVSVKLYTMHWPMIVRFYGDALMKANPSLSEELVTRTVVHTLSIADDAGLPRLTDYSYPSPDTPHPVGTQAQADKIHFVQKEAGQTPVFALAHGYGPLADFRARLALAWEASNGRLWINRYGYLTDEKIDAIRSICQ